MKRRWEWAVGGGEARRGDFVLMREEGRGVWGGGVIGPQTRSELSGPAVHLWNGYVD